MEAIDSAFFYHTGLEMKRFQSNTHQNACPFNRVQQPKHFLRLSVSQGGGVLSGTSQTFRPDLMAGVEKAEEGKEGDGHDTQGGGRGDHEHDHDPGAHRVQGLGSGQDLSGHHPR